MSNDTVKGLQDLYEYLCAILGKSHSTTKSMYDLLQKEISGFGYRDYTMVFEDFTNEDDMKISIEFNGRILAKDFKNPDEARKWIDKNRFNSLKEKEHLQWVYDRLQHVYAENPNVDYMLKLKEIVENYPTGDSNE